MVGLHLPKTAETSDTLFYPGYTIPSKHLEFLDHEQPECDGGDCSIINVFHSKSVSRRDTMIHIAVPDTQVLVEKTDGVTKYTAFNIHVNGWFHTAVRFSHLYQLAESIKQRFGAKYRGPDFPPKRLFSLDEKQLDDRRQKICKYLNALVQNTEIMRHPSIEKKFLELQINSFRATSIHVSVDVYLGDGEKAVVRCNVSSSTNEVLKTLAEQLGAPDVDSFLWNFGLFMAKPRGNGDTEKFDMLCVRLLRNFESPYISLQLVNQKTAAQGIYHKLVLRKLVWDPRIEETLLEDAVLTELLYKQAKADLANGSFEVLRNEVVDRLRACERNADHIQFLRMCHLQPSYSYERFAECTSDYPRTGTRCRFKIGRRQLVINYGDNFEQESVFRATRIRVWRISQPTEDGGELLFQFEYLMTKDTFEWITLYTDQGIILSHLIQSIANEILHEHRSMSIEQQLYTNGGGSGMSIFLEPTKHPKQQKPRRATLTSPVLPADEVTSVPQPPPTKTDMAKTVVESTTPPMVRRMSGQSNTMNLKSAKAGIITAEEVVSSGASDPLGVAEYESFNDVFTTITDVLPLHNEAFSNITDDDL